MSNTKWVARLCTGTCRDKCKASLRYQGDWSNYETVILPGKSWNRAKMNGQMQNVYICQASQGSNRRATYQSHLWGYTYQDHHRGCRCTQYCDLQKTAVRWPGGYGRTVRQSQTDPSHCPCSHLALQRGGRERTVGMKDHHALHLPQSPSVFHSHLCGHC